ncbi:MAG: GTPase HflX, partial [Clostridia bacterium]|nr:GTPase HflX [Clostridia bacterium]
MEIAFLIIPIESQSEQDEKVNEISSLTESAGANVIGYQCVKINKIIPSTYIGKGKAEEIKQRCEDLGVNLVVFDGDLTPSQTLNLSEILGDIKVVDRTTLILDIFASRAKSSEGKVQVELAQLKYIYPRLKGKGAALSRLGGGIGTRGPGESKLESDRRHIRRRINFLEDRLKELEKRRLLQGDRRNKNGMLKVALVGYTNTGKSTLLNALTGSDVLAENKLFATL